MHAVVGTVYRETDRCCTLGTDFPLVKGAPQKTDQTNCDPSNYRRAGRRPSLPSSSSQRCSLDAYDERASNRAWQPEATARRQLLRPLLRRCSDFEIETEQPKRPGANPRGTETALKNGG